MSHDESNPGRGPSSREPDTLRIASGMDNLPTPKPEGANRSDDAMTRPDSGWADALGLNEDTQKQLYNRAMARLFGADAVAPEPEPKVECIGRFELLRTIGVGGMGLVYLARDPDLDREVAIKLLHTRETDDVASKRLRREARAMAKLAHPNVVHIHEVGTHEGQLYLAMEFVDGPTLRGWLRQKPRTWQEIVEIYTAAGRGLQAAHEAGIVHRDFKPENVLITAGGTAKVTDFGLARDADQPHASLLVDVTGQRTPEPALSSGLYTAAGTIMGTPSYMSPEQFLAKSTDPRSDQFSFCVTLFEALIGERPYSGESYPELADNVINGNRIEVPTTSAPMWVLAALERGLHPDPDQRFPNMRELLAALSGETTTAPDIGQALDLARLEQYRKRARYTALIVSGGQLIYILLDYARAGASELFLALLTCRGLSILVALPAILRVAPDLRGVRRDALASTGGMALSYVVVNILYGFGGIQSPTMINWVWVAVLVLVNYSYPPHHLSTATWISTLLSLGFIISEYTYIDTAPTAFVSSIVALSTINLASFLFARQLHRSRRAEVEMLRGMVPSQVMARVIQGTFEVEEFAAATVLYADLTGIVRERNAYTSTNSYSRVSGEIADTSGELGFSPTQPVVELLFSEFDTLIRRFGVERVHNSYDGLLVVCGAPTPRPDHCEVMAEFALALVQVAHDYALEHHGLTLRIGLDTGPISASTIGRAKRVYDLWGDTVDIARRLQGHCEAGEVLISQTAIDALATSYRSAPRGEMWIPGRSQDGGVRHQKFASLHGRRS